LGLLSTAWRETKELLIDATPTFAIGGVLITVLNHFDGLITIHRWFAPITKGLLHLPDQATTLFILSVIKKDLGAAMLYSIVSGQGMTDQEITVALVVTTLFVPCFAATMVLYKDRGPIAASIIWAGSFLLAIVVGTLISIFFTLNCPLFNNRIVLGGFL
jgi:ferrous iron transport protein B